MSFAIPNTNPTYTTNAFLAGVRSFGASAKDVCDASTEIIKDLATSPIVQGVIGFGLGVAAHKIYGPLTEKIIKFLGVSTTPSNPFGGLDLGTKILLAPLICVKGPMIEEKVFRGFLQETLKNNLNSYYLNLGLSDSVARTASRVSSVFFSSVIFGLVHFGNAIAFWCNPIIFLPQVVATTLMGLMFGLAKDLSGDLHLPIGMHIGNNTFAWIQC